ncbi:transposase family protein [Streptomyces phaeochromogenes]|uniref:transposase family protein n=1 Tax=Streptomyces phaeochromogenes TaxID=1923 RepID=UPI00386A4F77
MRHLPLQDQLVGSRSPWPGGFLGSGACWITARRAELDELEEQLAKQLAEVRAERDELAVAERVLERMSEQLADERASVAPVRGQVGGRAADRRNYSGKHHHHGLHFLALTDERGRLIWISAARPGRTHDNTAARQDHVLAHLRAAGLGALADLGFRGQDSAVRDPVIVTDDVRASGNTRLLTEQHAILVPAPQRALALL